MGRLSILDKLDNELSKFPIRRESQVVYLLAEIRKVIEHERPATPDCYEVLELFCNWALHTSISRKSNADRIRVFLNAFDMKSGMDMKEYLDSAFFNEIMQLEAFKKELAAFLQDHKLPCEIVQNFRTWSGFIYLYTSVVAEIPLTYTKADLLPDEVEELVLTHLPASAGHQRHVRWRMKLKNGQERIAATLYGVYRNEYKNIIAPPDFYLEDGFQI